MNLDKFKAEMRAGIITRSTCSPQTINTYSYWVSRYLEVFPDLTRENIIEYVKDMPPTARNVAISALSTYAKFHGEDDLAYKIRSFKIKNKLGVRRDKTDRCKLKRIVTKLLATHSKLDRKAGVLLAILMYGGLRINEAVNLMWFHIDFSRDCMEIIGKGGKLRVVPMPPALKKILQAWQLELGGIPYVLPNVSGNMWTVRKAQEKIQQIGERFKLTLRPHDIRRSYITYLLGKGYPIHLVSKLAGHANIATTQIYEKLTNDDVLKATQHFEFEGLDDDN